MEDAVTKFWKAYAFKENGEVFTTYFKTSNFIEIYDLLEIIYQFH